MSASPAERLQEIWTKLPAHEQKEVLDFVEFLAHRRITPSVPEDRLSEEEHTRLVAALDAVDEG